MASDVSLGYPSDPCAQQALYARKRRTVLLQGTGKEQRKRLRPLPGTTRPIRGCPKWCPWQQSQDLRRRACTVASDNVQGSSIFKDRQGGSALGASLDAYLDACLGTWLQSTVPAPRSLTPPVSH